MSTVGRTSSPAPGTAAATSPSIRPVATSGQAATFAELLRQRKPPRAEAERLPATDGSSEAQADGMDTRVPPPAPAVLPAFTFARREEPAEAQEASAPCVVPEMEQVGEPISGAQEITFDERCRDTMHELGLSITGFCNDRGVADGTHWRVQMALRNDVIPDTTLHLSLSPNWLTLRFRTADPAAFELLSRGQEVLQKCLENTLSPMRGITITFDSS